MSTAKLLKSIIYFSMAIVPALAWYVADSNFFPFITGKNFAFRTLIEISFIAWIILAVHDSTYRPKKSIVFYSYSAFLIILCAANLLGQNPYFSFFGNYERMEGWFTHLHLFAYFTILYSVYKTNEDWMRMWGWFLVGSMAVASQAVLQLFGQKDFYLIKILGEKGTGIANFINQIYPTNMGNALRVDSTMGNSAYYGIYTLFFVFIASLIAVKMNNWKIKNNQGFFSFIMVIVSAFVILLERFLILTANALISYSEGVARTLALLSQAAWWIGIIMLMYFGYNFVKKIVAKEIGSIPLALFAILNVILLLFTQTRGSYFGLAGGMFVSILVFILTKEGREKYKKVSKYLAGILITGIVAASMLVAFKDSEFLKDSVIVRRIATIKLTNIVLHPVTSFNMIANEENNYRELVNYFGEATIVSRFLNAKISIDGINDSAKTLLLGVGQENYSNIFAAKYDPRMYEQEVWFDRAHNVFMDWLVAGGILGLIAYLALYTTPLYMMWFGRGKNNMSLAEKSIITGALTGYFIHNVFVFDNLISYIIFIAILAYVASITRVHDNKIENNHKLENNKFVIYGGVGAGIIASVTLFYFTVFSPLSTNLDIISTFRNSPTNYSNFAEIVDKNLRIYKNAIDKNNLGKVEAKEQMIQQVVRYASNDMSKASTTDIQKITLSLQAYKNEAEKYFEQMINEKPNARNTSFYSSYLRSTGQYAKSLTYAKMAYELGPRKQITAFEYVTALAANNMNAEALEIAKQTADNEKTYIPAQNLYAELLKNLK